MPTVMTNAEIATLIVSGIGVLISALAFFVSVSSKRSSNASAEISICNMINSTKEKFMDCSKDVAKKEQDGTDDDEKRKINNQCLAVALENYLNACESACQQYLCGNVSKGRFKDAYFSEIQKLVESKSTKKYYDSVSSKYQSTKKVYKKWFKKSA